MVAQEHIRPFVIGIHGKSASGKDTLAEFLRDEIWELEDSNTEFLVVRSAFADPLRRGAAEMFGIDIDTFHDRDLKDKKIESLGLSPTQILQTIGQAMREVNSDIWVSLMRNHIRREIHDAEVDQRKYDENINLVVIITDVRYPNEVDFVKSFFAEDKSPSSLMIWIKREDQEEVSRRADHISERAIADDYMRKRADAIITNKRNNIDALRNVAKELVDKYVKPMVK